MARLSAKCVKVMKTCNLYGCFFVLGLCTSVPGPTLIDLMHLVSTDIKNIAYIYTARGTGVLCGCLAGGVIFDMINRKQLALGIMNLVASISMLAVPWTRKITSLTAWMAVNGLALGFIDIGGNVSCLHLWGKDSGPFYQALHFSYSVGGFVAPLIAAPFLGNYSAPDVWDNSSSLIVNQTDIQTQIESEFQNSSIATNPVVSQLTYPYVVIGSLAFLVAIFFFTMTIVSPADESGSNTRAEPDSGKRGLRFTFILVFLTFALIFSAMGTEVGYSQMLTIYTVKGPLLLASTTGSYMTSAFWTAYTVSRLVAVFLAIKFSDLALLAFDVILTCLGSLTLAFLAVQYEWGLWLSSILLGLGIASVFPSAVSQADKYINVTNKILALFTIAFALGAMFIPHIIGHFMEEKPIVFVYVNLITSAATAVVLLTMYLILRKTPTKYAIKKKITNPVYEQGFKMK